jgi:hypothetical protein
MRGRQVSRIYDTILAVYVTWTFICATLFLYYSQPKLMVLEIANLNNVAIGFTAFFIFRNNLRYLPPELRPGWISRAGVVLCGVFYLGLSGLVFYHKQLPMIRELLGAG